MRERAIDYGHKRLCLHLKGCCPSTCHFRISQSHICMISRLSNTAKYSTLHVKLLRHTWQMPCHQSLCQLSSLHMSKQSLCQLLTSSIVRVPLATSINKHPGTSTSSAVFRIFPNFPHHIILFFLLHIIILISPCLNLHFNF